MTGNSQTLTKQTCYLCKVEKAIEEFIQRQDGAYYRMCKVCNSAIQRKKGNKQKNSSTPTAIGPAYKCMRVLENENFTLRTKGNYFSACKECNKYFFGATRRARLNDSEGQFSTSEFNELLKQHECCPECHRKWQDIPLPKHLKVPWAADHKIPISKGGRNSIDNIQPLCYSCNSSRGNKL